AALQQGLRAVETTRVNQKNIGAQQFNAGATVADALRRPDIDWSDVAHVLPDMDGDVGERVTIEVKVEGYVRRQHIAIEKAQRNESALIPAALEYAAIVALSHEAREKLSAQRPRTLGAAGRIPGVTPADVAILSLYVHRSGAQPALA
nr:tRNA uridine-5-carboxymethylaminomethyl(34) synthesis enzyme MnmG [Candidatus Eremiobacteraeota bacterium]